MLFVLIPLLLGSWVYCLLILVAARKYLAVRPPSSVSACEPISILKPLAGLDEGLEENLRTFFVQEYTDFEILFAVRRESDAAVPIVRKLQAEYPGVASRLLIVGDGPSLRHHHLQFGRGRTQTRAVHGAHPHEVGARRHVRRRHREARHRRARQVVEAWP